MAETESQFSFAKKKKIIWSYQLQPYDVYIQQKTKTADSRAPEEKLQLQKESIENRNAMERKKRYTENNNNDKNLNNRFHNKYFK